MRGFFGYLFIVLVSCMPAAVNGGETDPGKDKLVVQEYVANPGSIGKTHTYKLADLEKAQPITATTGDIILVIEEFKPTDAKQFKATSDNPHIKVRAVEMDGQLKILIASD